MKPLLSINHTISISTAPRPLRPGGKGNTVNTVLNECSVPEARLKRIKFKTSGEMNQGGHEFNENRSSIRDILADTIMPWDGPERACGAKTRKGTPCKITDVYNGGRCRFHGGLSTGPKTAAGKARSAMNGKRPKRKRTP